MPDLSVNEITETRVENLQEHYLRRGLLFVADREFTFTAAGSYEDKLLFRNPAGSGVKCIIHEIICNPEIGATTSQENLYELRIHFNPTTSAFGTGMAENNKNSGSATAANALVTRDPTITASGTRIENHANVNNIIKAKNFVIDEGDSLLLRVQVNDAANKVTLAIIWSEDAI